MKTKILNVLRKSDGYVSGQALCNMLGVSRTAVWKVINQLKEEGYVIEAVQNKGYHITQYPDILTSSEIMSQLNRVDTGDTTGIIREVVYYDETDSTNNEAKRAAEKDNAADGTLYITESQTGGRGRRGRNWASPAGSGIWMSLLLRPDIAPVNASMLTIVAAMAVQEAIHTVLTEDGHDAECRIKWPNDIVLNKKKICGILTEMSAEMDYIHYVVIGMGINVNTTEFDDSIKATASSLYLETGDHLKRSRIVAAFSESFAKYYTEFVKTQNLAGLKEDYNAMLVNKDSEVKAIYADKEIVGTALGINDEGELIIKTDEGEKIIRTGEVSVRGLYGYV
ncbi:MAG: biotin--[acetyl-CoA-carboxylase] ligase [Eubacteriales bacterium]|nr:biotin--[acetyl-CoA-carboxylase] ligase [Eubacteriales bacterium]